MCRTLHSYKPLKITKANIACRKVHECIRKFPAEANQVKFCRKAIATFPKFHLKRSEFFDEADLKYPADFVVKAT